MNAVSVTRRAQRHTVRLAKRLRPKPSVALAVAHFTASGLAILILVGVGGVFVLRHIATSEAIREARQLTKLAGEGIVEPSLADGVLRGDRASIERLDRVVRTRVLRDPVARVKIWTPSGKIVYSDESRLIGSNYRLGEEEVGALASGAVAAHVSDLSELENRYERSGRKLLEVYLPLRTKSGRPVLFETYQRFSSIAADGRKIWRAFMPVLLAALFVVGLVQVPLAWSMARRMRDGQREREQLLQRAIEASQTERRRIASDLHDGPVQDLAGMTFSLSAVADRIHSAGRDEVVQTLRLCATGSRQCVRQLRTLLVDIYPPSLHTAGLEAALRDLLAPLVAQGVEARLHVGEENGLAPETEQLVFRTAQEALRNVRVHAAAKTVEVRLNATPGHVELLVEDDGLGVSPDQLERRRSQGHVGLWLLADRARDLGGELRIDSQPGRGTRVRLQVAL